MLFQQSAKIILSSLNVSFPGYAQSARAHVSARAFHSLTYRLSGKKSFEINGKSVLSAPGTITYIPAGLSFDTTIHESGSMYAIHFITENTDDCLSSGVFTPSVPLIYKNMFSDIFTDYCPGRENDFHCFSIFYRILAEIRQEELLSGSFIPPRIQSAMRYIEQHFGENGLSVSFLAAKTGISEVYFRREFVKYCGMTPNAYINKIRIENAKALLKTGCCSVTETAIRCGFDSVNYFSDRFKMLVGMAPTRYKESKL